MYRASTKKQKPNQTQLLNKEAMTTAMTTQNTVCKDYSRRGEASFNLHILKQTFLFPKPKFVLLLKLRYFRS